MSGIGAHKKGQKPVQAEMQCTKAVVLAATCRLGLCVCTSSCPEGQGQLGASASGNTGGSASHGRSNILMPKVIRGKGTKL